MFAFVLALSVLALVGGLGLVVAGRDRPRVRVAVDGFILGVVPTLFVVHVMPHLWGQLGVVALGLVALGYGLLWAIEGAAEQQTVRIRVVVTVLALHSLLDGVSLAVARRLELGGVSAVLIAALVIHRVPEGIVVGALVIPRQGLAAAAICAAVLATTTLVGALAGSELLRTADAGSLGVVLAVGMGAVFRAVLHGHASSRLRGMPGVVSALVGAALAVTVPELP